MVPLYAVRTAAVLSALSFCAFIQGDHSITSDEYAPEPTKQYSLDRPEPEYFPLSPFIISGAYVMAQRKRLSQLETN